MKAVKFSILSCEKLCSLLTLITSTLIILKDRAGEGVILTFSKSSLTHLVPIQMLFFSVLTYISFPKYKKMDLVIN